MAAETVTLIVGVVGAVATLTVGALAYFKDRRDSRTQLLRDADLVERLAANAEWHDGLGVNARVALKLYVYERIHDLAVRENGGRRLAKSLYVLGAAVVGIIVLTNNGDYHWLRSTTVWILWGVAVVSAYRASRYLGALGRRREALAPPDPPGSPPREPSWAQRRREKADASRAAVRENWKAIGASWREWREIRKQEPPQEERPAEEPRT